MAEREEIREAEARLLALALKWRTGSPEQSVEAEVSAGFARQTVRGWPANCCCCERRRLEDGLDAELAMPLLRVWLDYAATLLDEFAIFACAMPCAVRSVQRSAARGAGSRSTAENANGISRRSRAVHDRRFPTLRRSTADPRLTPEMVTREDEAAGDATAIDLLRSSPTSEIIPDGRRARRRACIWRKRAAPEIIGRRAHRQTRALDLETAGARRSWPVFRRVAVLCTLRHPPGVGRRGRAARLGGVDGACGTLGETCWNSKPLKADFRQRLMAAWQFFSEAWTKRRCASELFRAGRGGGLDQSRRQRVSAGWPGSPGSARPRIVRNLRNGSFLAVACWPIVMRRSAIGCTVSTRIWRPCGAATSLLTSALSLPPDGSGAGGSPSLKDCRSSEPARLDDAALHDGDESRAVFQQRDVRQPRRHPRPARRPVCPPPACRTRRRGP